MLPDASYKQKRAYPLLSFNVGISSLCQKPYNFDSLFIYMTCLRNSLLILLVDCFLVCTSYRTVGKKLFEFENLMRSKVAHIAVNSVG